MRRRTVHALRRRRPRRAGRDARGVGELHRDQPPYWGKRDYGVAGQYGHEDSPAAYVATMREVFREARRVLADDGTCWLNLGDSYSASGGGATGMHAYLGEHLTTHRMAGMHTKNLLGLPWRVAFALQDDSWIVRNAIVWHKPNAMPESVRDWCPAGRAGVPARQVTRLLVRPRPDPRTAQDRQAA